MFPALSHPDYSPIGVNYGFSEWSEYRDVLVIARKTAPAPQHQVKVCLVKRDLSKISHVDIEAIAVAIQQRDEVRSESVDVAKFSVAELRQRSRNMMWFCGVTDLRHRDTLMEFISRFEGKLAHFPDRYFREGYRPVPKGVSSFLFLTRALDPARVEEAFLHFSDRDESARQIRARSSMRVEYVVERSALARTLRTGIGISTLSIEGKWDYAARKPYDELRRVARASGFEAPAGFSWSGFWDNVGREFDAVETRLVVVHRINPFSPSTRVTAFFSETPFSPSNVLNVIREPDPNRGKAVCVLLNSAIFLAQFFLLKEETTGRYINIRFYDLEEMALYPDGPVVRTLSAVFDRFAQEEFPALRDQLDASFEQKYTEYWDLERKGQRSLGLIQDAVTSSPVRREFDKAVCRALGVQITDQQLSQLYGVLVKEMIVTRGLQRD